MSLILGLEKYELYFVDGQYMMSGDEPMNMGLDSKIYGLGNMVSKLIMIRKIDNEIS